MTATDADDPTYGNSARVVYSIIHGHPYFSVEPKTGNFYFINISEQLTLNICRHFWSFLHFFSAKQNLLFLYNENECGHMGYFYKTCVTCAIFYVSGWQAF